VSGIYHERRQRSDGRTDLRVERGGPYYGECGGDADSDGGD
jgi:hypothetical protein